ncbi:MAG: hypothetical protein Q8P32_00090 [Candidatus Komeilibacteria bacterium]|nr:hypothetical protein [Candidatus Komeilibacteria bacterium]
MSKLISFLKPFIFQPLNWPKHQPLFSRQYFFLSFGDSLSFLLEHYQFQPLQQIALLPNFYCPETLKYLSRHFKIVFYQINDDFSVDKESYFKAIQQHQPGLIVNYCFTGFTLSEIEKSRLLGLIGNQTIIIEDYAHRIVDFKEWQSLSERHFIIDSIRKHAPVLGSHLINLAFKSSVKAEQWNFYKIKCHLLQLTKGLTALLAILLNSQKLHDLSEEMFFLQNQIIGVYPKSTLGNCLSFFLYNCLNLNDLKTHRQELSACYTNGLTALNQPQLKFINQAELAKSELNHYPLFVDPNIQEDLVLYLRQRKIYAERLWETEDIFLNELNLKLYSAFLILPLTANLTPSDAALVVSAIGDFFKQARQL